MKRLFEYILPGLLVFSSVVVVAQELNITVGEPVARNSDPLRYTQGLRLYQQNCASCHGKQGEGTQNWRQRDAEGKFLPPPLNGTGHTWHHPMHILKDIIRNGTVRLGGKMPAMKAKLTEKQIDDILFWVQSQWTDEIYKRWFENDQAVRENMLRKK